MKMKNYHILSLVLLGNITTTYSAENACVLALPGQCGLKAGNSCCAPSCQGTCRTMYIPRSTHANSSYWLSRPTYNPLALPESGVDLGYEYQHSFFESDIARCLFEEQTRTFAGSFVAERPENSLLAEQFGLSSTFSGDVTFSPTIVNNNFHLFGAWRSYYDCCKGFFARGMMTITHQTRSLFNTSCITTPNAPIQPLVAGLMSSVEVASAPDITQALSGTYLFGDMQTPWSGTRISAGSMSTTNLAGVTIDLGYTFEQTPSRGFSFFTRYRPGTGTIINGFQPYGEQLFAPIIGDGHHQGLGGGFSINALLWSDDREHSVALLLDGYVLHLFENCQLRTFDFTDHGCLSRYLLLKELQPTGSGDFTYTGNLISGVNFSTRPAQVSVGVTGEAACQIRLRSNHTELIVGYEFYGRQEESVCLCPSSLNEKIYGIKGCTGTDYFSYSYDVNDMISGHAAPFSNHSSATSSATTITTCGPTDNAAAVQSTTTVGVDWSNAFEGTPPISADNVPNGTTLSNIVITNISTPAQPLTTQDLNICSGKAPQQIIHKGMISFSYRWRDHWCLPYIMFGVQAEGSGAQCSLKQAGIWIQGGATF